MITGNAVQQAHRLASLGLKKNHICYILGLTNREIQQLEKDHPDISDAINTGSSSGLERIASAMIAKIETGEASVGEMIKAMTMIGGKEYSDTPATNTTTNNVLVLPSAKEALSILLEDPALDDSDRKKLVEGFNRDD